jgi:hypothetical protein
MHMDVELLQEEYNVGERGGAKKLGLERLVRVRALQ